MGRALLLARYKFMSAYVETIEKLRAAGYQFKASTLLCGHGNLEGSKEREKCACGVELSIPLITKEELIAECGQDFVKVEQTSNQKWEATAKDGTVVKKEGFGYVIPEQPIADIWINKSIKSVSETK